MDLLALYQPRANAPLDDLAKLMGYPGKLGMDGSAVWQAWQDGRIAEIRDYCETDVVNTYLVYLRFERMRGHLDAAAWAAEVQVVRDALGRIDAHALDQVAQFQQHVLGHRIDRAVKAVEGEDDDAVFADLGLPVIQTQPIKA